MKDVIVPFLMHDWIFVPSLAACVFVLSYLWADKVLLILHKRSVGQKDELTDMLDKMFVEVNPRHLTILVLLISFGLGALFFILFWPNIIFGTLMAVVMTIVGWSIPKIFIKNLYETRCNKFVDQMVDGMTIMSNGIKSGLSVTQCMERVVENMGNPISQEFGLVLAQTRVGRSVEEALSELGERIPRPDVQMFVTSVNILKETGGNMAETFSTITTTVRERQKVEKKIQAMTAQGLMQGFIISMVPFALMALFFFLDPNYIMPLFTTTWGWVCLLIVIALVGFGGVMIRKIVKINV